MKLFKDLEQEQTMADIFILISSVFFTGFTYATYAKSYNFFYFFISVVFITSAIAAYIIYFKIDKKDMETKKKYLTINRLHFISEVLISYGFSLILISLFFFYQNENKKNEIVNSYEKSNIRSINYMKNKQEEFTNKIFSIHDLKEDDYLIIQKISNKIYLSKTTKNEILEMQFNQFKEDRYYYFFIFILGLIFISAALVINSIKEKKK
jgi:hypothetical protein